MNLGDVKRSGLPRKYKFPVGRGHSSGIGKTCGRGRKGQKARTGTSFRAYFEGGQMSMLRRLPKFGFNNAAFAAHPARFKGVAPRPPVVPLAAWINPPKKETTTPTINPICSLNS